MRTTRPPLAIIGSIRWHLVSSRLYLHLSAIVDLGVAKLLLRKLAREQEHSEGHHLLLATRGEGNIGDQAMVEAFCRNVDGPIKLLVEKTASFKVERNVQVLDFPSLVTGLPVHRIRLRLKFLRLLGSAQTFSIIGADVMDGGYSRREAVLRIHLLRLASLFDVPAQVIGFSWSDRADFFTGQQLKKYGKDARLNARDDHSLGRLQHITPSNLYRSADVVFSSGCVGKVSSLPPRDNPYIILNTSGLIDTSIDLIPHYVRLCNRFYDLGYTVVLLPHVIRPGDNDLAVAFKLRNAAGLKEKPELIDRLLSPDEVRSIAQGAALTIAGRMHLGILSLLERTPPIIFSTQGKVSGLLERFDLAECCVEPTRHGAESVEIIADRLLRHQDATKERISALLPSVIESARQNFELSPLMETAEHE